MKTRTLVAALFLAMSPAAPSLAQEGSGDAASRPTKETEPAEPAAEKTTDAAPPTGPATVTKSATVEPAQQKPEQPSSVWQIVREIAFYRNDRWGIEVRPILRFAGGINHQFRSNETTNAGTMAQPEVYDDRVTTASIVQFGLKGQLFNNLTFYSEFERNMGSYGTSVWNGTAAFQVRMNYLRYELYNASIAGGIVLDPASADFVSQHALDMLGRDKNVADLPFLAGINMGQGAIIRYRLFDRLTLGLSYSSVNPLATSLSYGFGGKVSAVGNIYYFATKCISMGDPCSNAQLQTLSPGFVLDLPFNDRFALEARGTVQFFFANIDTNSDQDQKLTGRNFKGSLRLKLFGGIINPFINGNYRVNEMLVQTEPIDIKSKSPDNFIGATVSGGIDFNYWKRNGVGASYGMVIERPGDISRKRSHYINIGTTFWVIDDLLAAGARFAKLITLTDGLVQDGQEDYDSYFVTLRLVLN